MLELALVVRVSELTVGVPPWCLIPSIPCPSGLRVSCCWPIRAHGLHPPPEGLRAELAWFPESMSIWCHAAEAGPQQKGQQGEEGRNTLGADLEKKWKVKYLESNFGRPAGKCVGMFPKAWMSKPFPHPPPRLTRGAGVCAEISVELLLAWFSGVQVTSRECPWGARRWSSWGPCSSYPLNLHLHKPSHQAPALQGGLQLQLQNCRSPPTKSFPGSPERPSPPGWLIWDQHPRPSIRPVELGPWNVESAAAEKATIVHWEHL